MKHDEFRRGFLLRALAVGVFSAAPSARAEVSGQMPRPSGNSIHSLRGELWINGRSATAATAIGANDKLQTGADSQVIFVVGQDAFILRGQSELQLSGDNLLVNGLRLFLGALLSVFGKSRHDITTPTATMGIRGTGVYVEADADRSYLCDCYGTTEIAALAHPALSETIVSEHHSARYVAADGKILSAPLIHHSDEELVLLESLVGRTPPFLPSGDRGAKK